ncbi:hypothetical protein SAMN05216207_11603, partial [Pseudonocardia ammonioxydans]
RQYFPKGTSLGDVTQAQLDEIAHRLNTRPRKSVRRMMVSACRCR